MCISRIYSTFESLKSCMDMRVCTLAVTGFERSSKLYGTAEWEQIQLHYSVYFRQARSPLDIVWTSTFYTWLYSHRFMSIVSVLYIQSFASWYSLGKKINVQLNLNSAVGALPVSRRVKISKSREHFSSSPPESFKDEWCTENHTNTLEHVMLQCLPQWDQSDALHVPSSQDEVYEVQVPKSYLYTLKASAKPLGCISAVIFCPYRQNALSSLGWGLSRWHSIIWCPLSLAKLTFVQISLDLRGWCNPWFHVPALPRIQEFHIVSSQRKDWHMNIYEHPWHAISFWTNIGAKCRQVDLSASE